MTEQPVGPRCGNNPNVRLTPGDRKAVNDFKARLALQASAKPYIDSAVWVDGDPLMEVIAATVWERCARDDEDMPQLVCDDPRTIAAFAAAVARAHAAAPPAPADQAARSERYAVAIHDAMETDLSLVDEEPGRQALFARAAEAAVTMADAERTELRPLSPYYEHPACGFHWHGRDGMDIPMQDGEPVCPRCELRRLTDVASGPGRVAGETQQDETQADCNSGVGWYEVIHPRNATTCIAYAHEDGSLYLPEGDDLTPDEFAFTAARGNAHRLVRADDPAAVSQPETEA